MQWAGEGDTQGWTFAAAKNSCGQDNVISLLNPACKLVFFFLAPTFRMVMVSFMRFCSRESIRSLEEEGLIYSTVDEFHYKSTAGGWDISEDCCFWALGVEAFMSNAAAFFCFLSWVWRWYRYNVRRLIAYFLVFFFGWKQVGML